MLIDQPPAVVQPEAAEDSLIEVVGQRPDQAQKIDRRIYSVRDNAHSAAADGYQLLRGLPAVTIRPDDQLMLLGNPNVTILVDEHPIQTDPAQFLRTLHGSDVERIEIITNPSAQFPSAGTGGIVNFVLRKRRADGLTGSANAELSSLGRLLGGVTLKYKTGKWTLDGTIEGNTGRWSRSTYFKERAATTTGGGRTTDMETGGGATDSRYGGASANLGYALDSRTQVGAGLFYGSYSARTGNDARFEAPDSTAFSLNERDRNGGTYKGVQATFERKGKTEGETLKGFAMAYSTTTRIAMDVAVPVGGFTSDQRRSGNRASGQLDWTHPIGKTRILSLGGQFSEVDDIRRYRLDPDGGPGFADRFDPKTFYWAAYATYQQRFGSLTLMPGLRLETMRRDPSSPGQARLKTRQTDLFPTLHIDHPLAKGLDLSVSYSKRIDRADLESLRPYPVVIGIQSVLLGNPKLRDQSTDVYEANLHFHRGKLDLGLIAYDREIKHVWGSAYDVNAAGMSVTTTRNTGRESDRGAELDISSPLFRRIKTNASFNLFDSRVPVDFGSGTRRAERFRYTGNATIEYDDAQKHGRPGDIGQLQLLYDGPRRDYQIRYRGSFSASLSYTRSLTRTLALTGSAEGIGQSDNRHRLEAPLVQEYYSRRDALPLFKLKLVKTFSGAR